MGLFRKPALFLGRSDERETPRNDSFKRRLFLNWPQDGCEDARMHKNTVRGLFPRGETNSALPFLGYLAPLTSVEDTFSAFRLPPFKCHPSRGFKSQTLPDTTLPHVSLV